MVKLHVPGIPEALTVPGGVATKTADNLVQAIAESMWQPVYDRGQQQ